MLPGDSWVYTLTSTAFAGLRALINKPINALINAACFRHPCRTG